MPIGSWTPEEAATRDEIGWRTWVATRLVAIQSTIDNHIEGHHSGSEWVRWAAIAVVAIIAVVK